MCHNSFGHGHWNQTDLAATQPWTVVLKSPCLNSSTCKMAKTFNTQHMYSGGRRLGWVGEFPTYYLTATFELNQPHFPHL